ncbi:MAG: YqiA/YcfP family alpha/beta fold hydrolase [Halieaceae bacterium]|jgi:pimeloyl-ACP methyl ester carboxylesterase|nr:YqiA/YcfP family alpha/beta fold hydrolase [Halieaceae bacterium]
MHIVFSHGKESGPWGNKSVELKKVAEAKGCSFDSLDYTDLPDNAEARVERLIAHLDTLDELPILVGSSMGGYVATAVSTHFPVPGLFLMAPALYLSGYAMQDYPSQARHIEVVHGWSDDVIPVELSMQFCRSVNCTQHVVAGGHRLTDAIPELLVLFGFFLERVRA